MYAKNVNKYILSSSSITSEYAFYLFSVMFSLNLYQYFFSERLADNNSNSIQQKKFLNLTGADV